MAAVGASATNGGAGAADDVVEVAKMAENTYQRDTLPRQKKLWAEVAEEMDLPDKMNITLKRRMISKEVQKR